MKKMFKVIAITLIIVFVVSVIPFGTVSAKTIEGPLVSVAVSEETDDILRVEIALTENPGVGAMTFTLMYDKNYFSTTGYYYGYFYFGTGIKSYLVVNHPDNGYVSVVWADGNNTKLFTGTSTFLTMYFRVNNRVPGNHQFKIANINPMIHGEDLTGCFANFDNDSYNAVASNDSYFIPQESLPECNPHSFALSKKVEPSCTSAGYTIYKCDVCGATERQNEIAALGHDFESDWTVDRQAESGTTMLLSRHCTRCMETIDEIYISNPKSEIPGVQNKVGTKVSADVLKKNNKSYVVQESDSKANSKPNNSSSATRDDLKQNNNESIVENEGISATEIVEKIEQYDCYYVGGIMVPKKIKTVGDFIVKMYVYLFGAGDTPGIITVIFNAISKLIS